MKHTQTLSQPGNRKTAVCNESDDWHTLKVLYILGKISEGYGLKVNSCEASCSLQTPTVCFDISHSDHNNRGHSSSAGVCQSEERGEAGREVSTQSVSTCYMKPLKPRSSAAEGRQQRGLWPPSALGLLSQIKTK